MGREVVGSRPGRRRHHQPVTHQLLHPHPSVDDDLQPGRLRGLPQQRDLVDRHRPVDGTVKVGCLHPQGRKRRPFGRLDPLDQAISVIVVHQEADRAQMHPVDRFAIVKAPPQRVQHRAVPAQGNDHFGLFLGIMAILVPQQRQHLLRLRPFGSIKSNTQQGHAAACGNVLPHPSRRPQYVPENRVRGFPLRQKVTRASSESGAGPRSRLLLRLETHFNRPHRS